MVKRIGESKRPLVYKGLVKSGTAGSQAVEAYIFAFKCHEGVDQMAKRLHRQCSTFDHPNVMRSLGYGRGTKSFSEYMFVAFPIFDRTFSDYLRKGSSATEMGRFSIPFIQIVRDTVSGLEALGEHGFGCPTLKGTHIAVKEEGDTITAKIWNFSECSSDKLKDGAWIKLGGMLLDVSCINFAAGPECVEITDMCRKMINGNLKGLEILTQSALLHVQDKFDNVLSLWRHVSVNCAPQIQQGSGQGLLQNNQQLKQAVQNVPPGTSKKKHTLVEFLDLEDTISERPKWIGTIRHSKAPKTFRELLDELRDIFEHEDEYIPTTITRKLGAREILDGKREADLEHWIRTSWAEDFLKMQVWASNLAATL
ncbi:unnamed protein product [Urochloa decumbens]